METGSNNVKLGTFRESKLPSVSQFSQLSDKFRMRHKNNSSNFKTEFDILEIALFESFSVKEYMIYQLKQIYSPEKPFEGPRALIPMYYERNWHYLWGSYELVKVSLNNQCVELLRTVYESIQMMYYNIVADETDSEFFYKWQTKQLKEEDKKIFKNKYQWFKPAFIMKELYSPDMYLKQRQFYEDLSITSHPNIKWTGSDFGDRPEPLLGQ